uniref:Uncharacterized protein n=1 Tax=Aegilops tauschii subsp. strangulata TaxID=200361 RepID=A0A453PV76_AEGTS
VNGHVRKHSSMESSDLDLQEKDLDAIPTSSFQERKCSFSSCSSDGFLSSKESSKPQINIHNRDKGSGGVLQVADEPSPEAISRAHKSLISNVDEHDDRSKPPLIQQRGRFKVTPGNVELDKAHSPGLQKSHSMQVFSLYPTSCFMGIYLFWFMNWCSACLGTGVIYILRAQRMQKKPLFPD